MEDIITTEEQSSADTLKIITLGGVMEIGKNMTAYEYNDQILVVDSGLMFPEEEMLGVDIVIPDITYLEENADKILGIVLTHGHEDHIGALPYVLRRIDVPIWGTGLTLGFLRNKLSEHKLLEVSRLYEVDYGDVIELGDFRVEYLRISHSIPDAAGLIIRTPVGNVVMSGDFKFDQTPVDGQVMDIGKLARLGEEGVITLLCDSTNAEKRGFTPSESLVGESFDRIFSAATGRIIIAAFASNIHRLQQVYNVAHKHGRRVAVVGRSMEANSRIAEELGYLIVPDGAKLRMDELDSVERNEVVIMTTGSQGEPLSALSRMAMDEHKKIKIDDGDTVIISATPIPGNEDLVMRTVNRLFKQGAEVIYEPYERVHVSGHGSQEDIKLLLNLLKPQFLVPVHGEQRHYSRFLRLAETMGYNRDQVFKMHPGDVLETDGAEAWMADRVTAGSVMVDGLGVGDVEDVVLRDRGHLAKDGVVIVVVGIDMNDKRIVSGPDVLSRGFVGDEYREEIIEEELQTVTAKVNEFIESDSLEDQDGIKSGIRKALAKLIYERTHRRPMIVPVLMEV